LAQALWAQAMLPALSRRVEQFALQHATAVRLEDLYKWGQGDLRTRLRVSRFLRKEVAIRNAQLCKELTVLPFGLAETTGVHDVVSWFSRYVDMLAESAEPETAGDDQQFTRMLNEILEDNTKRVVDTLGQGVREVREAMGEIKYEKIRREVNLILDRFFMKRIGICFLLQHHIEAAEARPGASGIIHSNVAVGRILREASKEATRDCMARHGRAPEVVVIGDGQDASSVAGAHGFGSGLSDNPNLLGGRQFTYVPDHLHFACFVLLSNACRAVAQHHEGGPEQGPLPPVYAIFAYGEEQVTVKVSDHGGGIPRREIHLAWSYFESPLGGFSMRQPSSPILMGGAGLPLARLHARYYGGDLVLKSMEGLGTDAYLTLNRLGENCENLPHGVRVSPAMRDSSVDDAASIRLDSLGTVSEAEVAFLSQRLSEYREKREGDFAMLSSSALAP